MTWWESVRVGWRGLLANKLRSALTMIGVIIGVGAVVAMVGVGQGASRMITSQIQALGSNLIVVTPMSRAGGGLSVEDARELVGRVPTITAAVPIVTTTATVKWQTDTYETSLQGVTEALPAVRNYELQWGRFLSEQDVTGRRRVAVLGQTVVNELFGGFGGGAFTERQIAIGGEPFTVIGVLKPKGTSMGQDEDDAVFIPVTVAQRIIGSNRVQMIFVKAAGSEVASQAVDHLRAIFRARFQRDEAVQVTSQDELLSAVGDATRTFTVMLGAIAGISLLVGGVGIMNIMLVSVAERTREIGVRKAMGARGRDILAQFLIEAVVLSVVGGAGGIVIGEAGAGLLSRVGGWSTVVSLPTIAMAFIFSGAVGLFFGVYPATRAAALDPIVALRHD